MLNLHKTHFIHFCLSGHKTKPLTVFVHGDTVRQVESTTFLGFELDRSLSWGSHIDRLCMRLGSASFALSRLSQTVPSGGVRSCYFATVHSLLQYGAELWGRAADWERAFRMQKRAVRAVSGMPCDASARPLFKQLNILTLPSVIIYQIAVYVRRNLSALKRYRDVNSYTTRSAERLVSLSRKLMRSDRLTHVVGPTVYNNIPGDIVAAPSLYCFKNKLKRWLIEQTFYNFEEFISHKAK